MRRILASLLSVVIVLFSSIPIIQAKPACHSAAMAASVSLQALLDDPEHGRSMGGACHGMHASAPLHHDDDLEMSGMSLNESAFDSTDDAVATVQMEASIHGHEKQTLSEGERECRIECGCGCNRTVDGFPQFLAPHIPVSVNMDQQMLVQRVVAAHYAVTLLDAPSIESPPPKYI